MSFFYRSMAGGAAADRALLDGEVAGPQFFAPPTSGVAANGKIIFSWDEAAAQITRGNSSWSAPGSATNVTYAFRSVAPSAMPDDTAGFTRFTAAQIAATEEALRLWAETANITFTRVGSGTSGEGAYSDSATMLFGNYGSGAEGASAFAYFPGSRTSTASAGDVWVNSSLVDNNTLTPGGFGLQILAHEIGHAIGLSHPSNYDASDDVEPTYEANAAYWQDARMFTIMSYFGSANTGGSLNAFASGPQLHDIAAVQRLYGANMTTRAGDTVYGFNSNTGHANLSVLADGDSPVFAIWDAGGIDTIDLSGYSTASEIDLHQEAFSSAGPGNSGIGIAIGNISIARGAVIENAIGGSGADTLIGNSSPNRLMGNGGADMMSGFEGADVLIGGVGGDSLNGGTGLDTASYVGSAAVYLFFGDFGASTGEAAGDAFVSVENLAGSAFNDILGWDDNANVLDGGAGDDVLYGNGGADTLIGGLGFDTANYATSGVGLYIFFGDAGGANGDAAGDSFFGIESIVGSNFNDVIGMDNGNNMLVGGAGNDTLYGQGGGDRFFGNGGFDTVSYATASSGVYVYLRDLGNATGDAAGDGDFSSIESIVGSNFNDVLGMGDFNDLLIGGGGNDVLYGLGGGDRFFGNDGFDTVSYAQSGVGLYVFLRDLGHATGEAAGDGDFSSIESLIGSSLNDILGMGDFADTLIGGGGDDQLYGLGGNDTFYGGSGSDLYIYNGASFGSDTIVDWQDGADRIDFSRYTGADFGDLALSQEGGGVRVAFGADSILIAGAVVANVTAADFIFGP